MRYSKAIIQVQPAPIRRSRPKDQAHSAFGPTMAQPSIWPLREHRENSTTNNLVTDSQMRVLAKAHCCSRVLHARATTKAQPTSSNVDVDRHPITSAAQSWMI